MKRMIFLRKRRPAPLLLALFILVSSLTGCVSASAASDLTKGVSAEAVDTQGALTGKAMDAAGNFAALLLKESLAGDGRNTLVSPLSVYLALGMTANGAEGDTLSAFESVLGSRALSQEELNLVCKALSEKLTAVSGSTVLNIANAVWYDEGFEAYEDFLQANADYFGAAAYRSPFAKAETPEQINAWVKEKTKGLIPSIIEKLDPRDVMVLVNTLYLNAKWQREFNPDDTREGEFTLTDGSTANADFMSNGIQNEQILSRQGAKGVLLPYDDGKLAYLAVLPPEGMTANEYAASLDGTAISDLLESAQEEKILLRLPKHEAGYDITLNDTLSRMGLNVAFDPERADFSRMGTADGNLYISEVIHKTRIKVGEKGTEAAAATGVVMQAAGAVADDYITMSFDRPFVYAVVDLDTNFPLFLGVLENPAT